MTAKNRKGGTQLVLRNAENNQEIASTDIQGRRRISFIQVT